MLDIVEVSFAQPEFAECFAIRVEVFIAEQNVPADEEADEYDATARHFLALRDGASAGTARVIFKAPGIAKITRVAVRKFARKQGIGAALIRHIETAVSAREFVLDAQRQALPFYESLGFLAFGEEFFEAGIVHRRMRKDGA